MPNGEPEPASKSPVPIRTELPDSPGINTLDFFQAMKELADGKKIHKLEWEDKGYYCFLGNEVKLHKPNGRNYHWVISEGDLDGTDYIIV